MKQNEQIEGEAFCFFQSSLKQRTAKPSRLGGLWGKQNRLTESMALRVGRPSQGTQIWRNNVPRKSLMCRLCSPQASSSSPPYRSLSCC